MCCIETLVYADPLEQDIPRKCFQQWTRARLNVYSLLDQNKQIVNENVLEKILSSFNGQKEQRQMILQLNNPWASDSSKLIKRDNISHYICRLMFCLSPEKKDIFITNETAIFKYRLSSRKKQNLNQKALFELLQSLSQNQNIKYGNITEVETKQIDRFKPQIYASLRPQLGKTTFSEFDPKRMYKVPIQSCQYLISRRMCYIQQGFAYLTGQLLIKVLPKMYSKYLRLALDGLQSVAYQILSGDSDNQFRQFIRHESSTLFNKTVNQQVLKEKLNLKNIGIISRRSFPPCMIQMYDTLLNKKHLKHQARLQLTLFLKVAGLSLQDNQQIWKSNYTKGVNQSQQKQILYNVRHSYGQEGKRTDYNSKDCQKIINSKPTSGQVHGCPFKYYGDQQLAKFLKAKYPNINQQTLSQIFEKKDKKQFQLACRRVFEKTHPDPEGRHLDLAKGVGRQPNMYFYNSEKYYEQINK